MKEYDVREILDTKPGEPRWEVTAPMPSDPLSTSLVAVGILGDNFFLLNGKPHVRFLVVAPVAIHIWPQVQKAKAILSSAMQEARKLEKMIQALELVRREVIQNL